MIYHYFFLLPMRLQNIKTFIWTELPLFRLQLLYLQMWMFAAFAAVQAE